MKPIRLVALAGLMMVTVGVLWHAAAGPTSQPAPRGAPITVLTPDVRVVRPSPVPGAEAAVAGAWKGSSTGAGVFASACTPTQTVVSYPEPDRADVEVMCQTTVGVGSTSRAAALTWQVRLAWRDRAWVATAVAP